MHKMYFNLIGIVKIYQHTVFKFSSMFKVIQHTLKTRNIKQRFHHAQSHHLGQQVH